MSEPHEAELRRRAQRALRETWPAAIVGELELLPGGISSLTFAAAVDAGGVDRRVVVKVAPPGLEPVRNRDVLRQALALRALRDAPGVPVPTVLGTDAGAPPLFVMEHVPGDAYEPKWDASQAPPSPELVRRRAFAAVRTLAALHAVDPARTGLAGEAMFSPADELGRWTTLYATVGDDLRAGEAPLRRALEERMPAPEPGARAAIVHGDYRLGNILFDSERPAAIIDWEIWTLGDRRHDLAWQLVFADPVMERAPGRGAGDLAADAAMPPADELLGEYQRATGQTGAPADLAWFVAAARYKLGAALAALTKRSRRRPQRDESLERAAITAPALLQRGLSELRSAAR